MEEGEINEECNIQSRATCEHDPSFEWPGPEREDASNSEPPRSHILRFVVLAKSSVTGSGRIALVDGYTELHFGRDASPVGTQTPRVRVRTMEASKHHATVYWDTERDHWAIVDMGSMHGTFLRAATSDEGQGARLSSARTASMPRFLSHLDTLYIGKTGFIVHIHIGLPCADCSPSDVKDEIPLFSSASRSAAPSPVPPPTTIRVHPYVKDSKKAISALKRELLSQHQHASSAVEHNSYVDRSARRRALYPSSASDAPGAISRRHSELSPSVPATPSIEEPVSSPQAPLPATNVGHKLLMKQGWQPGSSLGVSNQGGAVEPLDGAAMAGGDRRGLGVHRR